MCQESRCEARYVEGWVRYSASHGFSVDDNPRFELSEVSQAILDELRAERL